MNEGTEQGSAGQPADGAGAIETALATIDSVAPDGWRIKLAKAAAQLIAGTEKGAIAYGQMRERIDTIEGRTIVSNALANAVATQAINDPALMERAKARFLGSALQKQENIEAVIKGANQYLPLLPAPTADASEQLDDLEAEAAGGIDGDTGVKQMQEESPLNADWAATFSGIAEDATSEELRDRLSKVLAGELKSPGTYSRATVRAIAELEQSDLQAMQAVLPYVLGNVIVPKAGSPREPSISALLPLSDASLITDANAQLAKISKVAESDDQISSFDGKEGVLLIFLKAGQKFSVPVIPLTRTGVAIADLLGRHDERALLTRIADELPKHICNKILLAHTSVGSPPSGVMEQLFPSQP